MSMLWEGTAEDSRARRPEQNRGVSTDPVINDTRHSELWMDNSEQDVKAVRGRVQGFLFFLDDRVTRFILSDSPFGLTV